jgi:hypothetical protein
VRFEYSTEQAYCLEFGDLYVRFYRNDGPLLENAAKTISGATQANPIVLTINGHGYNDGDDFEVSSANVASGMTQLNGRRFRVANKTTNTVELQDQHGMRRQRHRLLGLCVGRDGLPGLYAGDHLSGEDLSQPQVRPERRHPLHHPYRICAAQAPALRCHQLGVVHHRLPGRALSAAERKPRRRWPKTAVSGAGITISSAYSKTATGMANNGAGAIRVTSANHGYKTGDRVDITLTVGTTEANATWTVTRVNANAFDLNGSAFVNAWASGGTIKPHIFDSTDLGRLIRIQHAATWGYAKITAYNSAVSVTPMCSAISAPRPPPANWRLGLYSQGGGYPSCVTFFEGRLFFGGCPIAPTRVDGSMSQNYETFSTVAYPSVVADDNAVAYPLDSGDVNNVLWMKDDEKGLLVGTKGGEWMVRANRLNAALTPTNVKATRATTYGSYEGSQPVRTGKDVLFVQRKRRKVRNLNYAYDVDGFNAGDLTVLSGHIGGNTISGSSPFSPSRRAGSG